MSLLSKTEIQYLQGQKNPLKYDECKLKSIVSGPVSAFLQNEIPLVSQCPFMDLNTLMSRGKTGIMFSLAHKTTPTFLFPNFDQTIQGVLNTSKRDSLIQTQKFSAMICREQAQRKGPP